MALGIQAPKPPAMLQSGAPEQALVEKFRAETPALEKTLGPMRQEMDTLGTEMSGMEMPSAPQLQDVPQFQPRQVDRQEMMEFGGLAMAFSALASRAVRGNVALAMGTAASALEGFNTGNAQRAKLDIDNFNTKMKSAVEQNKQMMDEYNAVLNNRKITLAQKMQQYNLLANKYQDEIAMAALRKGDIRFELERMDKARDATNKLEVQLARMQATFAAQLARIEATQASQLEKPLPASDLIHYVHPQTGERPPPGTTLRNVIAGGYQLQSTSEQNLGTSVQGANAVVDRLGQLTDQLWGPQGADKAGSGLLGRGMTAAEWNYERLAQSNPELALYDSFVQGTVAPLIRSLGEKGTLATEDVARALNLLPKAGSMTSLPDTPEIARGKIAQLRELLSKANAPRGSNVQSLQIETLLRQSGQTYEPTKYEYRVLNGQVQRRPRGR